MRGTDSFFDTNVLLYLLSGDAVKADRAEAVLARGGTIGVQVLNEFAAVASRKLGLSYAVIREVLEPVRAVCAVEPITPDTHDLGLPDRRALWVLPVRRPDRRRRASGGIPDAVLGRPARRPVHRRAPGRPQPLRRAPERGRNARSKPMNDETIQFEVGSGNVYADLGFPDAEEMLRKA